MRVRNLRFSLGSGRLTVEVTVEDSGEGLVVTVFGGERPHVGTVVLAQPRPSRSRPGERSATASCLSLPGHEDEALARPVAEELAAALGVPVVAVAGVHLEGIRPEELALAKGLGPRIAGEVLRRRMAD